MREVSDGSQPVPVVPKAQGKGTIYSLQALRGLAALAVVLQHTMSMWWADILHTSVPITFNGFTGVDLFFVISGFIMPFSIRRTGSHAHNAGQFLQRRLERVVPLYWICTFAKIAILLLLPSASESGLGTPWHVISSFFFLPSFNPLGNVGPLLQIGWTLNMEVIFYLLIAIALWIGAPLRYFLPPTLVLLASGYLLHLPPGIPFDRENMPLLAEFLLGLVLAARYRARMRTGGKPLPAVLATPVFAVAFFVLFFSSHAFVMPLFFAGFLAMAIVGSALELEAKVGRYIPRFLLLLGDASYSIYLTHWFLVSVVRKIVLLPQLAGIHTFALPLALMLTLSLGVGILVYHFVESPINRYFHVRRRTATNA
jgi:exopolysaccharide production protein ExoZ